MEKDPVESNQDGTQTKQNQLAKDIRYSSSIPAKKRGCDRI